MGLWQQIKSGQIACEESEIPAGATNRIGSFSTDNREPWNVAAGKALIGRTIHQIAELWNEIETSGGSLAWKWIVHGSPHGDLIRQAEDRVNAVGSKGDRKALAMACEGWLAAWRRGIQNWKRSSGLGPFPGAFFPDGLEDRACSWRDRACLCAPRQGQD